jgi:hypothetical protein
MNPLRSNQSGRRREITLPTWLVTHQSRASTGVLYGVWRYNYATPEPVARPRFTSDLVVREVDLDRASIDYPSVVGANFSCIFRALYLVFGLTRREWVLYYSPPRDTIPRYILVAADPLLTVRMNWCTQTCKFY